MLDFVMDEKNDIEKGSSNLLEIESCGFYVFPRAFKTVHSATTWQLKTFLKLFPFLRIPQLEDPPASNAMIYMSPVMVKAYFKWLQWDSNPEALIS